MTIHRYFIGDTKLQELIKIDESALIKQWTKVLRYTMGRQLSLFNSDSQEAIYHIQALSKNSVHLQKVSDVAPKVPKKELYLCFALLKKDKNEWVLQKATELGVSHLLPLITERTEKTGWNEERAQKIVIEASEQCGRSDIPKIHEPQSIKNALTSLPKGLKLLVAEQQEPQTSSLKPQASQPVAVLIGPEGGWSDTEKAFFQSNKIKHFALSDFTLRAETAAITAVGKLL